MSAYSLDKKFHLRRFRLGTRLFLGFGSILVILVVTAVTDHVLNDRSKEKLISELNAAAKKSQLAENMKSALLEGGISMRNIGIQSEVAAMQREHEQAKSKRELYLKTRDQFISMGLNETEKTIFTNIAKLDTQIQPHLREAIGQALAFNEEAASKALATQVDPLNQQAIKEINKLVDLQREVSQAILIHAVEDGSRLKLLLLITSAVAVGMLLIAFASHVLNISEARVADFKVKMLAQRVVHSQEEERARLSRDLHDGISQGIFSIRLQVESGIAKLGNTESAASAHDAFERAASQLNVILGEVRRISHDLRPAILDDLGLAAALEHLTREFSEDSSLQVKFEANGATDGLPSVANTVLFRIAQEALTNIKRHANASLVTMRLTSNKTHVQLAIIDNGKGFNFKHITLNPKRGIGLRNMHERVEAIDGHLQLTSNIGKGTEIRAIVPKE